MSTTIAPIPIKDLGPELTHIGELLGLLVPIDASSVTFETDWFENPIKELSQIPNRVPLLVDVINDLLNPALVPSPLKDTLWFPIPNPLDGIKTAVYLVTPATGAKSGTFGLGVSKPFAVGELTIEPYAFLPLFNLPKGDFVLADGEPIQIGINTSTTDKITVGDASFTEMDLQGFVYFANKLPHFQLTFNTSPPTVIDSFKDLLANPDIPEWIGELIIQGEVWLQQYVGSSSLTVGELLKTIGILTQDDKGKYHLGIKSLKGLTPAQIAIKIVFDIVSNIIDNLVDSGKPLIPVLGGGLYVAREQPKGTIYSDYGFRLQIPDIVVSGRSKTPTATHDLVVQLGKWQTGDDDSSNWLSRTGGPSELPGINLFLLRKEGKGKGCFDLGEGDTVCFRPKLDLVSVGIDFTGADEKNPLAKVQRVSLGGIEPRFYLSLDFDNLSDITFGGAMRLDSLDIPLGPGTGSGAAGSSNPVAKNLLASGSNGDENTPANTVNSSFSLNPGFLHKFDMQMYDAQNQPTDTIWLPVQRTLGPVSVQKIGLGWEQVHKILSIILDGGVSIGPLDVEVIDLSVGLPITQPTNVDAYKLGLHGLDVSFKGGPVEITGGLLETTSDGNVAYEGQALIKIGNFMIEAYGAYTSVNGAPSFFIFAEIDYPLGGPAFFFVTGLAAGFGINRALKIPAMDQVQNFPLVSGVSNPSVLGGGGKKPTPQEALAKLDNWISVEKGQYWLAAGVKFTSFELINSNALVIVEFGKEFEIALIGLSAIKLPQAGETYAYAELMLEVVLKPDEGVFSATAILSNNSYVLAPELHLTGGFAFFLWFGNNPHAGDFVVTLGGYHPAFKPPAWYPQVPRLGFNWSVSDKVTIKGGAYFALTPSSIMAGGSLEVLFHAGNLRAWFIAYADLIVFWKPFYFEVDIGISIGISYRIHFLFINTTLKLEIGASLDLWGPPTGGKVHISLWIISFTIGFGADKKSLDDLVIDWDGFKTLLPTSKDAKSDSDVNAAPMLVATAVPAPTPSSPTSDVDVIHIGLNRGLAKRVGDRWIIRPNEFSFTTQANVPVMEACLINPKGETAVCLTGQSEIGIRPMRISKIDAKQTITITNIETGKILSFNSWEYEVNTQNMPEAQWGQPVSGDLKPVSKVIEGCVVGVKNIRLKPHAAPTGPPEFVLADAFTFFPLDGNDSDFLPLDAAATNPTTGVPTPSDKTLEIIGKTLTAVSPKRTAIFNALNQFGINAGTNGDVTAFAQRAASDLEAAPLIGTPVK